MRYKFVLISTLAAVAVLVGIGIAVQPKVETVTARVQPAQGGGQLYADYCASCHGAEGRGDGRAVAYLRLPVPDLTRISERKGKFDFAEVYAEIAGASRPAYHDMPVWSPVFESAYSSPEAQQQAMTSLVRHLERMQVRR